MYTFAVSLILKGGVSNYSFQSEKSLGENFLTPDVSGFDNRNVYSILCAGNMPT